jgi:uncharacterized protein
MKNVEGVRLNQNEIDAIKNAVLALDSEALIYLFGSRTDLTKRGGDIDLLILSQKLSSDSKSEIRKKLFETLEEQRIDIIIAKDSRDPFVSIALETGKLL